MHKSILRKQYKTKRDNTSGNYRIAASNAIYQRLLADKKIAAAKIVMSYISMGSEPDTRQFINHIIATDKKAAVPVVRGKIMEASYIDSLHNLKKSSFGALEPTNKLFSRCDPTDIDVIIVPGIVFDEKGYRIGYGGGYYDKYLPLTRAVKIGICFDFCITDTVYAQPHDVAVDYIITDLRGIF